MWTTARPCGALTPSLPPMEIAGKAIEATADYFKAMGLPTTLRELGIGEEHFDIMAKKAGRAAEERFCAHG